MFAESVRVPPSQVVVLVVVFKTIVIVVVVNAHTVCFPFPTVFQGGVDFKKGTKKGKNDEEEAWVKMKRNKERI